MPPVIFLLRFYSTVRKQCFALLLFRLLAGGTLMVEIGALPAQAQNIPDVGQVSPKKQTRGGADTGNTNSNKSADKQNSDKQSQEAGKTGTTSAANAAQNTGKKDTALKNFSKKDSGKQADAKSNTKPGNPLPAEADEDLINADRPGIANSSQVIGPHHFQVEIGIEQDYLGGNKFTSRLLTVPTLLRFGIDERYEFRIETAGFSALSSTAPMLGTQHTQGLAPVSLGFKRQFQTSKGPNHPSIGMIARFFPGSGSGAFRSNHFTGDVLLAADWDFLPKLSLNPNIGYAVYEDASGRAYGNLHLANTLTYAPTTRLNFFVDFGLQAPETTGGGASLLYDGGATYILGRNIQLDVSVGTGALGNTVPHPFWATGLSVRF